MNNPHTTIPLNQPNRDELIRVLEHIRVNEPETYERNVRECGERLDRIIDDNDVVFWENGSLAFSVYTDRIYCYSSKWYSFRTFQFRIKTRKP